MSHPGKTAATPLADDVLTEFADLPAGLRDAAVGMFRRFSQALLSAGMTPQEIAAIIAGPSFRKVLEDEARSDSPAFAQAS